MTLQASGVITMDDIVGEFGGTAPHGLKEYYNGGGIVGSTNTNVPTSGVIGLKDFYGAQAIANRDIRVQMTYYGGHTYSAFGVSSANSSATPQSFSGSNSFSVYSPVFRAGTGYLGQNINFTMSQNEDAQATNITLFGGTSSTAVNDTVLSLNGAYNSSGGGSKSYQIVFDSAGAITSITQTGSAYNSGIISVATNNPNSNHRWYQWRVTSPSYADKGSTLIQGDPTTFSSVPQPA